MPLPTPQKDEPKDKFVDRCMGDDTMRDEYRDPGQRRAICESQWDEGHKEKGMSSDIQYGHIITAVLSSAWAILPGKLAVILDLITFRAAGGTLSAEEVQERIGAAGRPQPRTAGQVQIIPIMGTIVPRGNLLAESSGAVSAERLAAQFRQAMVDPAIGAVVFDIDSPGGAVQGIPELAAEIYRARGSKPILAVANTLSASAAYWLAVQADEVYASPSGEVGSIGVLAVHENLAGLMEKPGVQTTLLTADISPRKAEGHPFGPLDDEARAYLQSRVDEYGTMFVGDVAKGRGVSVADVREHFGQGRVMGAKAAKAAKLMDGMATLSEGVDMATRRVRQSQRARAELDLRQRRLRAIAR